DHRLPAFGHAACGRQRTVEERRIHLLQERVAVGAVDSSVISAWSGIGWPPADARFTNAGVQTKINQLSHRTRGQNPDDRADRVSSQFAGTFKLQNSRLAIPHVTFTVPGAA